MLDTGSCRWTEDVLILARDKLWATVSLLTSSPRSGNPQKASAFRSKSASSAWTTGVRVVSFFFMPYLVYHVCSVTIPIPSGATSNKLPSRGPSQLSGKIQQCELISVHHHRGGSRSLIMRKRLQNDTSTDDDGRAEAYAAASSTPTRSSKKSLSATKPSTASKTDLRW
jgi:hypothetical protein